MSSRISLAAYRPRPGKDEELLELFEAEFARLRTGRHVTDRRVPICRTDRGEYLAILEWSSDHAVDDAHRDAQVLRIWARKAEIAEYLAPRDLAGSDVPFVSYTKLRDV
jgi:hypothetical protein